MMELVRCTNCNKSGHFKITLTAEYDYRSCGNCHNHSTSEWRYYFCNMKCQQEWMNSVNLVDDGFPCRSCRETGWAFGFESNGVCDTCNGFRKVKL